MRIKVLILVCLLIGFFQISLFPRIYSRIEGQILDADSGEPVKGVWVNLFDCTGDVVKGYCLSLLETQTDKDGNFSFPRRTPGQYFLVAVHRDYVVYGPAFKVKNYLRGSTKYELKGPEPRGGGDYNFLKNSPDRNFTLKEGEVKHFKIRMTKSAKLEVSAKVRRASGQETYKDKVVFGIYSPDKNLLYWGDEFRDGFYSSRCLQGTGDLLIVYNTMGYFDQSVPVALVKGQVTKIDLVFDFTQGLVVQGKVIDKSTKKPVSSAGITIYQDLPLDYPKEAVVIDTNYKGEFSVGGIKPGDYVIMVVHAAYHRDVSQIYEKKFTIKNGETIDLTIEL